MSTDEAKEVLQDAQNRYLNDEDVWHMLQHQIDSLDCGEGV